MDRHAIDKAEMDTLRKQRDSLQREIERRDKGNGRCEIQADTDFCTTEAPNLRDSFMHVLQAKKKRCEQEWQELDALEKSMRGVFFPDEAYRTLLRACSE